MRLTPRLFTTAPLIPPRNKLVYNLGLSYAAKHSPPFVSRDAKSGSLGFAGAGHKVGKWVDSMRGLPAGRGELFSGLTSQAETNEEIEAERRARQESVMRWGAGEDFFAIVEGGAFTHIAISDGVGGWAPHYDPSYYAQALMFHYAQAAAASPSSAPWEALKRAYAAVEEDDHVQAGSATAVAVSLGEDGKGRAVNLGDSGLSILRRGETVFESTAQTHFFNCPYQLSKVPLKMRSPDHVMDTPERADKLEFDLQPGDIVILYTDGFSDNLPSAHVPLLNAAVERALQSEDNAHLSRDEKYAEHARLLADILLVAGRQAMTRTGNEDGGKGWKTPFEIEARRHHAGFAGGKIDDITVLTAVVSERLA